MRERPILFSAPMVRAILDGRKTQTRRVIRENDQITWRPLVRTTRPIEPGLWLLEGDVAIEARCPYGAAGDRLWVRETMWRNGGYVATDAAPRANCGKVPAIHTRRIHSRIDLEIVSVRVERLQEISESDIDAEGVLDDEYHDRREHAEMTAPAGVPCTMPRPRSVFGRGWDSINGKRASWSSNPWVWCVEFRMTRPAPLRARGGEREGTGT